nr:Chain B, 6-mer peptide from Breakpoint cluster region protein [synthetic construct]
LFSTEV